MHALRLFLFHTLCQYLSICFPAFLWWFSHSEWIAGGRHKGKNLNFFFCPNLRMPSHLELVSGLFVLCVMKSQSTKADFGKAGRKEGILFLLLHVQILCQWNLAKLISASSALLSSAEGTKLLSTPVLGHFYSQLLSHDAVIRRNYRVVASISTRSTP